MTPAAVAAFLFLFPTDSSNHLPLPRSGVWQWSALPSLDADDAATPVYPPVSPESRLRSKKYRWLEQKTHRTSVHFSAAALARNLRTAAVAAKVAAASPQAAVSDAKPMLPPPGLRIFPAVTLFNEKTREALPIIAGVDHSRTFDVFLRDHYTNQATDMDGTLLLALMRAARHFDGGRIDVVSGYRSPKYNLILRKKGHEVARTSQHCLGKAVDFRLRGVPATELLKFVRSMHLGGVGFYPHSEFVHCDTGPVRFWNGS